ncbi:hypothetical protein IQ273_30430 [Nodosilinea sp. LEGE 07298]|uniref:hypothetical protein n=1 Tax=Nodosilinea sp. LEGE 07298 TaxID=2777970 RepID=UPI001882619C|nr:hypothetical protein [Nodosilinea sp. LEGE 07298]MBE9113694.1 hypothetical protein [Nodosilinea sp. LEGE 07298]
MDIGKGSEGTEFVSQRSRAADDGLHLVGVDGGGIGSGIEGHRIVEESNDAIGCRVGVGILVPFVGLGQGRAAIKGE